MQGGDEIAALIRETWPRCSLSNLRIDGEVVDEGEGVLRAFFTFVIPATLIAYAPTLALLDLTAFGRREAWQDMPAGRIAERDACWFWRTDVDGNPTWGPTGRPAAQWTRPGATAQTTLGRTGMHH